MSSNKRRVAIIVSKRGKLEFSRLMQKKVKLRNEQQRISEAEESDWVRYVEIEYEIYEINARINALNECRRKDDE